MRGFKALLKKEVRSAKDDSIIGNLKDIYFSHSGRLLYIAVKSGNVLNGDKIKIFNVSNVKSFTKDAIQIKDVLEYETKPRKESLSAADTLGKIVKSEERMLGISEDVYFDFKKRRVTGIGISSGFLLDVYNGIEIIPFDGVDINKNFILCPSQNGLRVYNGGIKNIIKREE